MPNPPQVREQTGLHARLQVELFRIESRRREFVVLIVFVVGVLALGAISLFFPRSFWQENALEIRISPQILFVIMILMVAFAFYVVRREWEIQKLRLASLEQTLEADSEQAASMTDVTTNVFARSFLRDLLQGEVARAERSARPLALMMCDLNDFKQVNDRYGHLMGDYVLAQIASILKSCVRGSDYVIRYGGDEFLLVLPETDVTGGEIVKNRIYEKVAEWDRENRVGDIPVSITVGLYFHVAGQSAEQDIAEVDAQMYREKQVIKTRLAEKARASSS